MHVITPTTTPLLSAAEPDQATRTVAPVVGMVPNPVLGKAPMAPPRLCVDAPERKGYAISIDDGAHAIGEKCVVTCLGV